MTSRRLTACAITMLVCLLAAAAPARADCNVVSASDASFGQATSFAVRATSFQTSTTSAGLNCSGAILSVFQNNDHVFATLQSLNGGLEGPDGDLIPYTAFADSARTIPLQFGVQFDYVTGTLLNLLGLFSGPSTNLPMFFSTSTGANVAAGDYSDTITIQWEWDYCEGIGLFGICIGRDWGSDASTFDVTMTVTNACEVTLAPNVDLGQAPVASRFSPVGQGLSVVCTRNLAFYTVGLSGGENSSGGRRRMAASGGSFLEYDIFKSGGSSVWGGSGADRVANAAPGHGVNPETFDYIVDVYDDQATPGVGIYDDTVIVDVSF